MSLRSAEKQAEAEQGPDEATSETSAVLATGGGSTTAASTRCGAAPSGASWTHPPVKQAASSSSGDSGELEQPTCVDDAPESKETWCRVESMPRESWLRRRRKHWHDQSKSTVFLDRCDEVEEKPRCDWVVHSDRRDQRRHHFPGRSNALIILIL